MFVESLTNNIIKKNKQEKDEKEREKKGETMTKSFNFPSFPMSLSVCEWECDFQQGSNNLYL